MVHGLKLVPKQLDFVLHCEKPVAPKHAWWMMRFCENMKARGESFAELISSPLKVCSEETAIPF